MKRKDYHMKKTLLSLLALVASITLHAQNGLTVLENPDGDYYGATCISPNGRYIGGTTLYGMNAFIYDTQTGESTLFDLEDEDYGDCVNSVSDNGKGAGYGAAANIYSIDGTVTVADGFSILNGISADGQFVVGNYTKTNTEKGAAYMHNGKAEPLPMPTEDELGFAYLGSYAKFVSADSSVICGCIVDKYALLPALLWVRGDDGTYKADAICLDYSTQADATNPYMVFSPTGMSENGEWVALWLTTADEQGAIGRYNTKTRKMEAYVCDDDSDFAGADPLTAGIANDGTLVGTTGYSVNRMGFIWEAGEDKPQLLAERFPLCTQFAEYDAEGYHTPAGISADGRYITGWAATDSYYSYILDTETAAAGINGIQTITNGTTQTYTIDGIRLQKPARGLVIERRADGTVVKRVQK